MQKQILKALLKKEKKELKKLKSSKELSDKNKAKISRKFNRLVEDKIAQKDVSYDEAWQEVFDAISADFKLHFEDFLEFEEEILDLIFNNK
jgi:hypothetical protein